MLGPAMLVVFATGIFPLLYSLRLSFLHYSLLDPARGINFIGLANYVDTLFGQTRIGITFWESLWITARFMAGSLLLEFTLGLGFAVLLSNRFLRRRSTLFRPFFMVPMLLPTVFVGMMFRFMFQYTYGLSNFILEVFRLPAPHWLADPTWAQISLILSSVWQWMPFSLLVFLAGISSIPPEQFEAASVDGATSFAILRFVTLPWLAPVIRVVLLIRGIDLLRQFDLVYILNYGGPGTSTSTLSFNAFLVGFRHFEIGEGAAYGYLLLLIINVAVVMLLKTIYTQRRGLG